MSVPHTASRALPFRLPKQKRFQCRHALALRHASTSTAPTIASDDISATSSLSTPDPSQEALASFDPVARARARKRPLPPSRYQLRPPKYNRGPLHPIQPPPPSSPSSRLFTPGPFSLPRLEQTYHSTLAPDLLTLLYTHHPPGTLPKPLTSSRLRSWDDSSPYHKNRPLRAPRGQAVLGLMDRPITFRNVPRLEKITLHSFLRFASDDSDYVYVASMVLQAISGVRTQVFKAKHNVMAYGLRPGKLCSVGVEMRGEAMYDFLGKLVEVVMPKAKEWSGVSGGSGDDNGGVQLGFGPEVVGAFPEIEGNYDAYPPKMIPGLDITLSTTATNNEDARLLLAAMGIPFHGKHKK